MIDAASGGGVMRILVLDDEQYRHAGFARRFKGEDVTHALTAADAVDALNRGERFDLAQLDHDLGHGNGTGLDVADYIAAMPPSRQPRLVVIHSFNPVGASLMHAALYAAGVPVQRVPYGWNGEEAA